MVLTMTVSTSLTVIPILILNEVILTLETNDQVSYVTSYSYYAYRVASNRL